jgi:hypothetical protein
VVVAARLEAADAIVDAALGGEKGSASTTLAAPLADRVAVEAGIITSSTTRS